MLYILGLVFLLGITITVIITFIITFIVHLLAVYAEVM